MEDPDIPEIIEEGTNPGWRIRVGVSRQFVRVLLEAEERGIWFETEEEMDKYMRRELALSSPDEDRDESTSCPGSAGTAQTA